MSSTKSWRSRSRFIEVNVENNSLTFPFWSLMPCNLLILQESPSSWRISQFWTRHQPSQAKVQHANLSPCRLPDCHLRPVLRIWTGSYRDRAETTHYILLHTLLRIVKSLVSMFFQPVLQLPSLAWIPFHLYHSLTTFAVALHPWGLYFLDDLMVWPWYKREDHHCSIGPKCLAKIELKDTVQRVFDFLLRKESFVQGKMATVLISIVWFGLKLGVSAIYLAHFFVEDSGWSLDRWIGDDAWWIWEHTFSPPAYLAKPTRLSGHSIDAAQWGFVGLAGTSKEASKKGP